MVLESLAEALASILSAGGFLSIFVYSLLKRALDKARRDAERRKQERNKQELLRLEGEERMASLVLTLVRFSRGECGSKELEAAEREYTCYMEKVSELKRQIITETLSE